MTRHHLRQLSAMRARSNWDGTFTVLADGLDRSTSMRFIGTTAYIVTLAGEIWTIADVAAPPFGR